MQVPFYRHSLKPEYAIKVAEVLKTPFLTSGPVCKEVEAQLTEYFNVKHAKLVNSWTNGAVATLLALDVGPGDEVIVPAMTFIATANVVELVGATPIFIDCDPDTLLVTPELVKKAVTKKTKAVMPVHMYGQMCDVKAIKDVLPTNQKIYIIEDCAHSFESKYNNERPGKYSDAAIFSFYATKNVTCGEGGAVITNDEELYKRLIQSVLHGMSEGAADRFKFGQYKHWGMEHLGTKANLSDILASLLPEQIKTIDQKLIFRNKIANIYQQSFKKTKIILPKKVEGSVNSWHIYPIYVGSKIRDAMIVELGKLNIGTTVNYRAVTSMQYYKNKYKLNQNDYLNSTSWGEGTLTIPFYLGISREEQKYVIESVLNIMKILG